MITSICSHVHDTNTHTEKLPRPSSTPQDLLQPAQALMTPRSHQETAEPDNSAQDLLQLAHTLASIKSSHADAASSPALQAECDYPVGLDAESSSPLPVPSSSILRSFPHPVTGGRSAASSPLALPCNLIRKAPHAASQKFLTTKPKTTDDRSAASSPLALHCNLIRKAPHAASQKNLTTKPKKQACPQATGIREHIRHRAGQRKLREHCRKTGTGRRRAPSNQQEALPVVQDHENPTYARDNNPSAVRVSFVHHQCAAPSTPTQKIFKMIHSYPRHTSACLF